MHDLPVPVTLLTGFLGAGKTTLLNLLIRDPEAGRIAVIMNEFGDAGLDHDLIEESTEEIVLMQSGCLCCSIRGDLSRTLLSLVARRMRGELGFDRIVIETTGLADPGPILQTLLVDRELARLLRMDGVVTVADAAVGPATLDAQFEAVSQIAMADLIVMTKTDLVLPGDLAAFEARLGGINPGAPRIRADHGRVPVGSLLGLSAMRQGAAVGETFGWLGLGASPKVDPLANLSGFAPASKVTPIEIAATPHDARIGTASIEIDDPIPATVFDFWLDTLIALKGPDILRVKGIVHLEGFEMPFVFHGVQHIFEAPVPMKHWPKDDRTSRIVVIARDIDRGDLAAVLQTLRIRLPAAPGAVPVHERTGLF